MAELITLLSIPIGSLCLHVSYLLMGLGGKKKKMVSDIGESPRNTVLVTAYDKSLRLHLKKKATCLIIEYS